MNNEGQRIVEELDRSDEDAAPGRHRAPTTVRRRVFVGLGAAALCIVVATGLGLTTADVLGLTGTGQAASAEGAVREILPSPEGEPRAGRAIDLTGRPAVPPAAPQADAAPADPPPGRPSVAAAAPAADEPAPVARAARAPVQTVRTGDTCPTVGRAGVTGKGDAAVCTASPGNGPNKWRLA
jgi:hypothetical protein